MRISAAPRRLSMRTGDANAAFDMLYLLCPGWHIGSARRHS